MIVDTIIKGIGVVGLILWGLAYVFQLMVLCIDMSMRERDFINTKRDFFNFLNPFLLFKYIYTWVVSFILTFNKLK